MRFGNILLSLALSFIVWSCAASEERDFKNAAKKLNKVLIELNDIKSKPENAIKIDGKVVYQLNDEKRIKFIIDKENEWEDLSKRLESYMVKYPKSPWADDAGFCLVIMFLSISESRNNYYIQAINEAKNFLARFPNPHIENWTKAEFKGSPAFEIIFGKISARDECLKRILNLPEGESIRSFFTRAIIKEFLKADKISEARKELRALQKESVEGKELFICLQNEIDRHEKFRKMENEARAGHGNQEGRTLGPGPKKSKY